MISPESAFSLIAGVEMTGIRALVAAVLAVLAVMAVLPLPQATATALMPRPRLGVRFLQVVAHPDDDLLFMSPDLFGAVGAGRPSVTVYLTAGEGRAGLDDDRDPRRYAFKRASGVRAAYAYLAGVRDVWSTSYVQAGQVQVRVDTLFERPDIQLVFAGLPDGGDPRAAGGRDALTRMWADGACVPRFNDGPGCLRRGEVVGMLRALYARFRPTVLRTLDPGSATDHPDHVASARFALAAGGALEVRSYSGYPISQRPPNLAPQVRALKRQVFEVYRRHDYRAALGWHYRSWLERMYRCTRSMILGHDTKS